jgi:hypothetical protein
MPTLAAVPLSPLRPCAISASVAARSRGTASRAGMATAARGPPPTSVAGGQCAAVARAASVSAVVSVSTRGSTRAASIRQGQ